MMFSAKKSTTGIENLVEDLSENQGEISKHSSAIWRKKYITGMLHHEQNREGRRKTNETQEGLPEAHQQLEGCFS